MAPISCVPLLNPKPYLELPFDPIFWARPILNPVLDFYTKLDLSPIWKPGRAMMCLAAFTPPKIGANLGSCAHQLTVYNRGHIKGSI